MSIVSYGFVTRENINMSNIIYIDNEFNGIFLLLNKDIYCNIILHEFMY